MDTLTKKEAAVFGFREVAEEQLLPEVQAAFGRLQQRAADIGVDLAIASGYRSFDRQLSIWNRKVCGELPILDHQGQILDVSRLSDREKVFAILRWSALPGASRHHWGTDCDVYDKAAMPPGYSLRLTQEEARSLFATLHHWLDREIATHQAEGFYRPYGVDRGGIAPEPWHLSYAPRAESCEQLFCIDHLANILRVSDMALRDIVLENLPAIYQRFILLPTSPLIRV
jgi:LAS superfamily LD-carboxypeptidase LdcB